jgi:hypothetical protein
LIELLVEYHKFMLLKAKDSVCQPSAVIGEIWRVHSSMGDYNQFCENVCGKFIPYSDNLSGFSRTVELYNKYYNRILNVKIWSPICRVDDINIRFKLPSGQIITLTLNPFDSSSDIRNRLETTGVNMKGLQIIHRSIPIEKKMGLVSVSAKDGDLVYIARNIGSINY